MHYKTLNDTTEGELIFDHVRRQLDGMNCIEDLERIYQAAKKNFYVGSFSACGDLLSQWRGYGDFCIGFDL